MSLGMQIYEDYNYTSEPSVTYEKTQALLVRSYSFTDAKTIAKLT